MSQKQLNRYSTIQQLISGNITTVEAASALGLSERQIKRLKKGVIQEGPAFLIHKSINQKPSHALSDETRQEIITLKKSDNYKAANFLHFKELLEEHEGIKISYSALHSVLTNNGIESPKKRRRFKPHRRRKRKPQAGLLIQMDATPHDWFGTGIKFSLHGGIDDATGKIVGLYLSKNECLHGYFEVTRQIVNNQGIPVSIYADRHSIFLSTKASKITIEDQLSGKVINDTQFGRAMSELGITLIAARSPQAKGRVERLWATLQSRLPVEFKLAGVTTVDQANEFLRSYISKFNNQFAVQPQDNEIAFRPCPDNLNIDYILCVKTVRSVDNGAVLSFYNKHYKVITSDSLHIPPKAKVHVLVSPSIGVKVEYKNNILDVVSFIKPKRISEPKQTKVRKPYIPSETHYFKYGHSLVKKVTFEDSDLDVLKMLEDIFLKHYA